MVPEKATVAKQSLDKTQGRREYSNFHKGNRWQNSSTEAHNFIHLMRRLELIPCFDNGGGCVPWPTIACWETLQSAAASDAAHSTCTCPLAESPTAVRRGTCQSVPC
eukprot:2840435-Amphidinium_carterae.1